MSICILFSTLFLCLMTISISRVYYLKQISYIFCIKIQYYIYFNVIESNSNFRNLLYKLIIFSKQYKIVNNFNNKVEFKEEQILIVYVLQKKCLESLFPSCTLECR